MRVVLSFIAGIICCFSSFSQTFNGTGGNIPNLATTQTCFNATVSGVGVINGTNGLVSVCMNITHADVGDLEIVLRAPDGTVIPLTMQNGGNGNNFNTTCFTATATNPIKSGSAPFNGSFLPEGHLGAANNGQNANGTWSLCILDRRNNSGTGTVNSWSLSFGNNPAPLPPALPACANTLPSSSSCATATLVCDFNGQCGSTAAPSVQTWPALTAASCFSLQNNSFIRFIASATTASFSVWIPTTIRANYLDGGLQMLFFSGNCNGPVTTYGCYEHIYPYSGTGQPTISVISASGLTPGNTYYLMIDGYNGDNCTFTIAANTGVNVLNINPAAPSICEGASVNLTATGGNGVYNWSPATYLNTTSGSTVTATPPLGTQTYTVSSTTATGCPLTKDVTVTVNPLPVAPTATVTQPTCAFPTGTITVTAPTGAGLQYSVNGGPYQASGVFANLPPGASYSISVQNAAGCAASANFVVNAAPAGPPAPTVTITQPTCTTPAGTITITAPTGPGLLYSIGGPFQSSPVFTGLAQNVYNVVVQNGPGCTSMGTTANVNAVPTPPAAPAGTVVQATCTVPTGTISITAPLGPGLQYSLNGGPYQSSPVFNGLTPGTYSITVQNGAGCTSAAVPFMVGMDIIPPATPTATVLQPTCAVPTGTITFTSPVGAQYVYRIIPGNAIPQASPVFSNLAPGPYVIMVGLPGSGSAGCFSVSNVTVDAVPAGPPAPTVTVTQPTCGTPQGSITVTAPTGPGILYSIGGPFQSSPIFTGLAQNVYNVVVQSGPGCTSMGTTANINMAPVVPATPTGTILQPTCPTPANPTPTGSIFINAPVGTGLQYSLNGGPYQTSPSFGGLAPGSYSITVQSAGGCVSPASAPFVITAVQTTPPTFILVQPTCTSSGGTLTVTSPLGGAYGYGLLNTVTGIQTPAQASPVFNNIAPGSYLLIAQFQVTNCLSAAPFTITAAPSAPAVPVAAVSSQPNCTLPTGTITVSAPIGTGLQYSINGGAYQTSPVFAGLTPGTYTITAQDAGGCVSAPSATLTVTAVPVLPSLPIAAIVQPGCTIAAGTITVTSPVGANYAYALSGGPYQSSPVFNNLAAGTYSVTVRNTISGCISAPLTPLVISAAPTVPGAPVLSTLQPNCTRTDGSITVTSPVSAGFEYNINGGPFQTNPVFQALLPGPYQVRVRSIGTGCESAAASANINLPQAEPAKPVLTQTQPSCPLRVGEIRVDLPVGTDIEYNINGGSYQSSNIFPNLPGGNYTVTARFTGTTCVSETSSVQINGLAPEACIPPANGDIYFPSAFTPNGDGRNDGFGPGPKTSLGAVTGYTLMIFNRYGEKVYESNDPLAQWNGTYKGKMLANNSYTWVAKYRYGTRAVQMQKGSVTIIQ